MNAATPRAPGTMPYLGILVLLAVGLGACGSSTTQQADDSLPVAAPAKLPPATASGTTWTIPDLVGADLQNAQNKIQSLTNFSIIITTSHDATGAGRHQVLDRNWKVCSQNIPPGSTIDSHTRIDFGAVKLEERCP